LPLIGGLLQSKISVPREKMLWDEVSFTLNPGISLSRVVDSFSQYYTKLNIMAGYESGTHVYEYGRSEMFYGESGGSTLDSVVMYLAASATGRCTARFIAVGDSQKSTESQYAQVKKFFMEGAKNLLKLERWGEPPPDQPTEHTDTVTDKSATSTQPIGSPANAVSALQTRRRRGSQSTSRGKVDQAAPQLAQGQGLRACAVCHLGFEEGDLLAWCPFCGSAAHRVHLLEFLHVKDSCPACGHHLEERALVDQLKQARLRVPEKRRK
jgi:hypothetical protein